MKILRVSEEKNGWKLRFGTAVEGEPLPFALLITTVRIQYTKDLAIALKQGAGVARINFEEMQKFNASDSPIVRGANASSSSWAT